LDHVEKRDSDLWRGFDPSDGTIVVVHLLPSAKEAKDAAKAADLVHAAAAGRYVVTGAAKSSGNDGQIVKAVAGCLG
jgi:hypothetical protein